jgi:hypothetical protein
VKRAVQSDLARFKAYVEMEDAKGIEYRSGSEEKDGGNDQSNGSGDREQDRAQRAQGRSRRRARTGAGS